MSYWLYYITKLWTCLKLNFQVHCFVVLPFSMSPWSIYGAFWNRPRAPPHLLIFNRFSCFPNILSHNSVTPFHISASFPFPNLLKKEKESSHNKQIILRQQNDNAFFYCVNPRSCNGWSRYLKNYLHLSY